MGDVEVWLWTQPRLLVVKIWVYQVKTDCDATRPADMNRSGLVGRSVELEQ